MRSLYTSGEKSAKVTPVDGFPKSGVSSLPPEMYEALQIMGETTHISLPP